MTGLPRQPFEIPFDAGLVTRGDKRAKNEPAAERLLNMEFDDTGGARVRFPFGVTNTNIIGGGTLTNCRSMFANGDELVVFTDTALYTWIADASAWKLIGTHLAVACDEQQRFTTTDDQMFCDRAELNGVVFYVWSTTTQSYVAAADKTTGAVVMAPNPWAVASGFALRPRLVALATRVLLFYVYHDGGITNALLVSTLDPANPSAGLLTSATIIAANASTYDVVKIPSADTALLVGAISTASYIIAKVAANATFSSSTKARTADACIAVAVTPDAVSAQVLRTSSAVVLGDLITVSTLADVFINQTTSGSYGGAFSHIAVAYRSVKASGRWRAYMYVSTDESGVPTNSIRSGWIDDAGNFGNWNLNTAGGGAVNFVAELGVASRAFDWNGSVYVWLSFAGVSRYTVGAGPAVTTTIGALQNTYFLYRDDALLVAKAVGTNAGGSGAVVGLLPGVALVNGTTEFAWCGTERRIVPVGDAAAALGSDGMYASRAPRDVTFSFDDDRARRCVRLGQTMYIAGGLILQYDGTQLTELGYQVYPWDLKAVADATPGAIANGQYAMRCTYRWDNAQGERDRSTTATTMVFTQTGGASISMNMPTLPITRKTSPNLAIEVWRTGLAGSLYYLATSLDPTVTTGANPYIANGLTTTGGTQSFLDSMSDAFLTIREEYPGTGNVLPDLPPPSATIISASDTRLFLAGVAGQPDTVWYSKQRQDGHVASFNDALTFSVPSQGGAITAIDQLEAGIVVWRETATYLFAGSGFDNTGGGGNYYLSRIISTTTGAESMEAVCYDDGTGWFVATSNGWYLLDKAFNYQYVGAGVYKYDSEPILAATMLTGRTQFRVVTPYRVLVLDTLVNKWAEWTISDGIDMTCDSSQTCWYLTPSGPRQELSTWSGYAGTDTSLSLAVIETTWMKPDGRQQGRYIVDWLQLLGEFRSTCAIQVQLAKDYEMTAPDSPNWHTTYAWTPTTSIDGNAVELRVAPAKKRCASIKAAITIASGSVSPLTGPSVRLTSLTGQYAVEPGVYGSISAAQKG